MSHFENGKLAVCIGVTLYSSGSDVSLPLLKVVVTVTTTFQPDFPDFGGLFFTSFVAVILTG